MDVSAKEDLLNSSSLEYVEQMYLQYTQSPDSVPDEWRAYFESSPNGETARGAMGPSFKARSLFDPAGPAASSDASDVGVAAALMQQKLDRLVRNFRVRGHRLAELSPLGRDHFEVPELDPAYYGISEEDMDRPVLAPVISGASTVGEVIEGLRITYTRSIGAQFMHIDSLEVRVWLQRRMESTRNRLQLSRAK